MGLLLGLLFGVGVLLIIWSFVAPPDDLPRREGRLTTRSRDLLASAGVEGVTPAAFMGACAITGVVAFLLMFLVSATLPIGLVFGIMAGGVPVALLKSRARKRLAEFRELWPDVVDNISSAVRAGSVVVRGAGAGGGAWAVAVARAVPAGSVRTTRRPGGSRIRWTG